MRPITFLLPALAVSPFTTAAAQEPLSSEQAVRSLCFRGRPLPTCRTFWITEAGYSYRLTGQSRDHSYATWEVGLMRNLSVRTALGATLFAGFDGDLRWALKGRFRRWVSSSTSLEVAPGVLLTGCEGNCPGFTGHLAVNFEDRFAFTSHVEVLNRRGFGAFPGRSSVAWYIGVKLGSQPGVIATGVEAVALVGVLVLFLATEGS